MTRTESLRPPEGSGYLVASKPRAQALVDARTARPAKADEVLRLMVDEG